MAFHALIVEQDAAERHRVRNVLCDEGWQVTEANSLAEAIRGTTWQPQHLVFCEADLAPGLIEKAGGKPLINFLKGPLDTPAQIVVMGSAGGGISAFEAILNGASDYLRQPCSPEAVRAISRRARARLTAIARENTAPCPATAVVQVHENMPTEDHLIGSSEALTEVYKKLGRSVRDSKSEAEPHGKGRAPAYLITGETGTGKELIARLIHRHSRYRRGSFIAVNCSNLSPELADAELFGSTPGAYTGAAKEERPGLWELAAGGSLFLDEITEAPQTVLPKLLRVLQDGQIKRLGARRWISADVQVITATNRDMSAEIREGRFRADLYHRLNLFNIHLPPLRERLEDVPLLAQHFAQLHSGGAVRLSMDALDLLVRFSRGYAWWGNIRELENVIRRIVHESLDSVVYAIDLRASLQLHNEVTSDSRGEPAEEETLSDDLDVCQLDESARGLEEQVRSYKKDVLRETLNQCGGNYSRTARTLHISRPKLYRLLKELNG